MKVASSCAQCAAAVPAMAKPKGYLRLHLVPERLFDQVTSDFFHLGDLEGEECHWTNKNINGVLLIPCKHSGYIHVLPCNVNAKTGKAAAKRCAKTWIGCWDVPSEISTDSGRAYISEWGKALCAPLGIHHLRCELHQHRALPAKRAEETIINMLRKELTSDKDVDPLEIFFALLSRYHNTICTMGTPRIRLSLVVTRGGGTPRTIMHSNRRMHQHLLTVFRPMKKRPSASFKDFRQIGCALPTKAEENHRISKKETVCGSARAKLPRMETPSSSPCRKVLLKLCLESGRTLLRCVWM